MNGYAHPAYAHSLAEFGSPRPLPRSGGWLLERPIPGSPYRDAMGCYPLFAAQDWSRLYSDLDEISGGIHVHQLGIPDLLSALRLMGKMPREMVILGIQADSIALGTELTPAVESGLRRLVSESLSLLAEWTA